ncbi:MAG: NUDIX domain-containing protein [Lachnospiraceae bacterium]|jgi:isopentenyldiphosphate isomerase|nr:NUDIX domain-containing protein [Lachnospiraceae bacterium]MCR4803744.1 NUDIX domain-containing protein [Lachnospiraceae bacterium]
MELWDVYDQCMQKTERTHPRCTPMKDGDYHLIVHVYPINSKGEILIQKRAESVQTKPNIWATTGGSVLAGEDMFSGALRELEEELSIKAEEKDVRLLGVMERPNRFRSVWLVRTDVEIDELTLQKEEVADAKWATPEIIKQMMKDGEFWKYDYMDWLFRKIKEVQEDGWNQKLA